MDALRIRADLRKMGRTELLKLVTEQKILGCLIGGTACRFCLRYKEFNFCVSEIMGHSCQLERLNRPEDVHQGREKIKHFPGLIHGVEMEFILTERKTEFKVYHRDQSFNSMVFLGKVRERRKKERGSNLKDLLNKAIMDYSDRANDPSGIFLIDCNPRAE